MSIGACRSGAANAREIETSWRETNQRRAPELQAHGTTRRCDLILGPLSRASTRDGLDAATMADVVVALIWKNLILEPDSLNDALAERIVDFAMGPADGGT